MTYGVNVCSINVVLLSLAGRAFTLIGVSPLLKYGKLVHDTLLYVVIHIVGIHILELTAVIVVRTLFETTLNSVA